MPPCCGVARSERFELPTLGIEIRCSIQLSYRRSKRLRRFSVGRCTRIVPIFKHMHVPGCANLYQFLAQFLPGCLRIHGGSYTRKNKKRQGASSAVVECWHVFGTSTVRGCRLQVFISPGSTSVQRDKDPLKNKSVNIEAERSAIRQGALTRTTLRSRLLRKRNEA